MGALSLDLSMTFRRDLPKMLIQLPPAIGEPESMAAIVSSSAPLPPRLSIVYVTDQVNGTLLGTLSATVRCNPRALVIAIAPLSEREAILEAGAEHIAWGRAMQLRAIRTRRIAWDSLFSSSM